MPDRPNIAGSFNGWNPEPMQNLTNFLQKLGPLEKYITNEALFEDLISDPKFRNKYPQVKCLEDCGAKQWSKLEDLRDTQYNKLYTYWGDTLQSILKYKRPQLLNLKLTTYTSYKNIFVTPVFMNPGRQHYLV